MKKLLLPLMIAAALAGCSSFPTDYDKNKGVVDEQASLRDMWSTTPAVTYMKSTNGVLVTKFRDIPEELAKKPIKLEFKQGSAVKLADLIVALRAEGYEVVSRLKDSEQSNLLVTYFNGTLGSMLKELMAKHNIAYEYRDGSVFLLEASRYAVSLPQHKGFMDQVSAALKEIGATDVRADVTAGKVYYWAKPDKAEYLADYLETIGHNSAMVNLQVAVMTVGSHRDLNLGFDWANSAVKLGGGGMSAALMTAATGGATGAAAGAAAGAATAATTASNMVAQYGQQISLDGTGVGVKFSSDAFSLNAAIKALSQYGNARTDQNVVMGTLNGQVVKISSGNDIPYVKNVGSATTTGGAATGSTQTDIIKSGLKLEVTPNFDFSDGSVVTTVKVDMSTLVGFRELSAGNQVGTLSQPEMQNLTFDNVGRLKAGETIVMGGITYDQINNNYTNLPGMETLPTGSKAEKKTRNSIYIAIRPTVIIFTPDADVLNNQRAFSALKNLPAVVKEEAPAPKKVTFRAEEAGKDAPVTVLEYKAAPVKDAKPAKAGEAK